MTLFDFRNLPDTVQIDILYSEGIYVGKRKHGTSIVVLYQLESFYVEVFYTKYRRYIRNINSFQSTAFLNPYLELIDVDEIIKVR